MNAQHITHPSLEDLEAFGLRTLPPSVAETVLLHLETCQDCRQIVNETMGDSGDAPGTPLRVPHGHYHQS